MSQGDIDGRESEDARGRGPNAALPGDWLEVDSPGGSTRRGQIVEVLGSPARPHYRVRWDEEHVSLFFPQGHTHIIHAGEKP